MPNWQFQTGANGFLAADVKSTKRSELYEVGEPPGRILGVVSLLCDLPMTHSQGSVNTSIIGWYNRLCLLPRVVLRTIRMHVICKLKNHFLAT